MEYNDDIKTLSSKLTPYTLYNKTEIIEMASIEKSAKKTQPQDIIEHCLKNDILDKLEVRDNPFYFRHMSKSEDPKTPTHSRTKRIRLTPLRSPRTPISPQSREFFKMKQEIQEKISNVERNLKRVHMFISCRREDNMKRLENLVDKWRNTAVEATENIINHIISVNPEMKREDIIGSLGIKTEILGEAFDE